MFLWEYFKQKTRQIFQDLNDILRTADQLRIRGLTTSTNTKNSNSQPQDIPSQRPVASAAVISDKHDDDDEERKMIIETGDEGGDSDPEVIFRQSKSNSSSTQAQSNATLSHLRTVRTGSRASQGSLREGNVYPNHIQLNIFEMVDIYFKFDFFK